MNIKEPSLSLNDSRLHSLDLCRGFCALGVISYHFCLWSGIALPSSVGSLLMLLGTYGVSVFFILSGYSLAHAYHNLFVNRIEVVSLEVYIRRRIGRLGPLFILVLFISLMGKMYLGGAKPIEPLVVLANASLLFGFFNPAASPVIGGWSIGVEVVFYVIFPLLMVLRDRGLLVILSSALLTVWISFDLSQKTTLEEGWKIYVMPANHFIFFCAGVYARIHAGHMRVNNLGALGFIFVIIIASGICVYGATDIQIVTGWRRIVLVVLSVLFVIFVGHLAVNSELMCSICGLMGSVSYPLYLVHPLIYFSLRGSIEVWSASSISVLFIVSLVVAFVVNHYFDAVIQKRIKKLGW